MEAVELYDIKLKKTNYIQVADSAAQRISNLIEKKRIADSNVIGMLVTLKQKGCAGYAYKIEYAKPLINVFDGYEIIRFLDFDIFVNPKISLYLINTIINYKNEELESGFFFTNPNSKGECGCGESFFV